MSGRLLFFLLLLLGTYPAPGQVDLEPEPMRYLVQKGQPLRVRGFAASLTELSGINNRAVLSVGGQGAALFNRHLWVGAYGITTVTPVRDIVWDRLGTPSDRYTEFTQVGGLLGYSFRPKRAVHVAVSSRIGVGFLNSGLTGDLSAVAFVVTPQADVELNLFRWLRASVGVGYRFVGNNSQLTSQNTLNSPALSVGLSFGWFD
ncbi:hypothetical protein [uncultured Fibrella sp.]|uniref:hypothetical protein n=1 Tax=uncultured Fibrella sp. TaxID=1284596 RepID=UPI0035CA8AA1